MIMPACRSQPLLSRDPNVFRVRHQTAFGNGVAVGSLKWSTTASDTDKFGDENMRCARVCEASLSRVSPPIFSWHGRYEDLSRGVFVWADPPTKTIKIASPDGVTCVVNGCCDEEVLEALDCLCGPRQACCPQQTAEIRNWWRTGSTCPCEPDEDDDFSDHDDCSCATALSQSRSASCSGGPHVSSPCMSAKLSPARPATHVPGVLRVIRKLLLKPVKKMK